MPPFKELLKCPLYLSSVAVYMLFSCSNIDEASVVGQNNGKSVPYFCVSGNFVYVRMIQMSAYEGLR